MNNWLQALENTGATLHGEHRLSTSTTQNQTLITPLIHQQVISVIGPDAQKFLQGQLTCDIAELDQRGSGLGAHCTIKGAMLALYRLMAVEGGYWLRLSAELREQAQTNLNKYIIFSKAETADLSEQVVGLGLSGLGATTLVERLMDRAPSEVNGTLRSGQQLVVKLPGKRYELWLPVSEAIELLPNLLDSAAMGSTEQWELQDIQAGIPDLRAASAEHYIPQMTNLQAQIGRASCRERV